MELQKLLVKFQQRGASSIREESSIRRITANKV